MLQRKKRTKAGLPEWWSVLNLYAKNISYILSGIYIPTQIPAIEVKLVKITDQAHYDMVCAYILAVLIVTLSCSGTASFVRRISANDIIGDIIKVLIKRYDKGDD